MPAGPQNMLRELEAALLYTPPRLRCSLIRRLDRLLPELRRDQLYTFEYLFDRVTGFKPETGGETVLGGDLLQRRLGRMLRKLSQITPLKSEEAEEEVLLMPVVASQCRVGLATLRRWSKLGLPVARYALPDGRQEWGVRRSALEGFLAARRTRPDRESRRMTDEERDSILSHARELAEQRLPPAVIVARLVEIAGFSPSTIRRLLRQEFARPDEHEEHCGLSRVQFEELVKLRRAGARMTDLAVRFDCPVAMIQRALLKRVLDAEISYVPNPSFAARDAESVCLGDEGLDTQPPAPTSGMMKAPANLPPYLAELYTIPLLSREREQELFRKFNYIKYRAAMLQEQIRRVGFRAEWIDRFDDLQRAADQVRRILIRCNLRLVVSIAKRHMGPLAQLPELISEGNMCLIRTVESYDFAREARFATYATWAISKHFARVIPEENYRTAAFLTGQQEKIDAVGDARSATGERAEAVDHIRTVLARATATLDARERAVITSHYGTDGQPARTLEEIGAAFGLTRERIRQIEARALLKLRDAVAPELLQSLA